MDFRGRTNQSAPVSSTQATARPSGVSSPGSQFSSIGSKSPRDFFKLGAVLLLFSITGLVIALTFLLVNGGASQQHAVQKSKFQAVFLNNGQVYFGNIQSINQKAIDLRNIYYLQTSGNGANANQSSSASSNVSLVKLGCELHAPYDQMLINSDQVIFWENLQDTSQVVTAINKYKTDNKGKAACSQQSQSSTQQAPSTPAPTTTPAPAAPTIKKP